MPIAINQSNANDQHYEVPSEFYVKVLGPYLKYSCGLWTKEDTTLEQSEVDMLKLYCERADLKEGKIDSSKSLFRPTYLSVHLSVHLFFRLILL